jgi:Membrane protein involved in the export of O-antigen and teichoic acid
MPDLLNFNFFKNFFTQGHERTLRAKKNVIVSFFCKVISIIISFLIVPLTLGYVGKVEYGIWMAISSIIQWFAFFDIGLGNGLRNKLAEALALGEKETAKIYISSVVALISCIATVLFILFFIFAHIVPWNKVLNTSLLPNSELLSVVVVVFFFFCMGFVLNLVSSVLQAMQRNAVNDILGVIAQLLGLFAIFILVKTTKGSLFNLCLVYSGKTAVVMLIAAVVLFNGSLKIYRPSIKYVNLKRAFPLISLGMKFFINQILYMVVNQTAIILVVQFFGPGDVTTYNLAVRYFSITSMGYMMVLTPFLSAFTEAYTKKEFTWIKTTIKRINWIWMITSTVTIIMALAHKLFFKFWVGNAIILPIPLVITLAISSILSDWNGTYGLFLNGIGRIQLQLYWLAIQALLFFPLSFLFYKLGFGLASIVSTQIFFYVFGVMLLTFQYKKIINHTAVGIWNK